MNGLITTKDLADAMDRVRAETVEQSLSMIEQNKPVLYGFIIASVNCLSGRLALVDVPNGVVRDNTTDVLEMIAACLIANRIGVNRLFENSDPYEPQDQ